MNILSIRAESPVPLICKDKKIMISVKMSQQCDVTRYVVPVKNSKPQYGFWVIDHKLWIRKTLGPFPDIRFAASFSTVTEDRYTVYSEVMRCASLSKWSPRTSSPTFYLPCILALRAQRCPGEGEGEGRLAVPWTRQALWPLVPVKVQKVCNHKKSKR